jgi:hypothetical protein
LIRLFETTPIAVIAAATKKTAEGTAVSMVSCKVYVATKGAMN